MFDPTLLALVGSLLGGAPASPAPESIAASSAQTTCPVDIPLAKAAIHNLISDPRVRESENLEAIDPASLRLLTDATDATVCAHFRANVRYRPDGAPGVRYAYYKAGGNYFVAIMPANPTTGEILPLHSGVLMYDSTRTQLGFYLL